MYARVKFLVLTISHHVVAATFLQDFGTHVKSEGNGMVSHEPITSGEMRGRGCVGMKRLEKQELKIFK